MKQNQSKGLYFRVSRNAVSAWSINIHAYQEANLVPMAVLEICFLTFPLNGKKLFFKTNLCHFDKIINRNLFLTDDIHCYHYSILWNMISTFRFYNKTARVFYERRTFLHNRFMLTFQKLRRFCRRSTTVSN